MSNQHWPRTLLLMLLGMGTFFMIAALLTLALWFTVGNWRRFLGEVALLAALATLPVSYFFWTHYLVQRIK